MVGWLPAIKAVLPYLAPLVSAAAPAFNSRRDKSFELLNEQIAELQSVSKVNAEGLRTLAAQLKKTVEALESAAAENERRLRASRRMSALALLCAGAAAALALAAFWS